MVRLQSDPIRSEELIATVRDDGDGAVVLFLGAVRNRNAGRRVRHLEYQAYDEMAQPEMARLEAEALGRFDISAVALAHRTGRLQVGEVAVGIAVASPHRTDAFAACRFIIDELKKTVPIWKKECFEDGEVWIEGPGDGAADPAPV
jgi:molybdopterin synthase catalytic subunit